MLTTVVAISLVIVLLLAASAFFSGSETALTGANAARMHLLAKGGDRRAARGAFRRAVPYARRLKRVLAAAVEFGPWVGICTHLH